MNLSDGILNIDNFIISNKTTLNDFENSGLDLRITTENNLKSTVIHGKSIVFIDKSPFLIEVILLNNKISTIILRPCIDYPIHMTDPCERQQMRYIACARWLFSRLGKPHRESQSEKIYTFDFGTISTVMHLLPNSQCDAGYIVIKYDK